MQEENFKEDAKTMTVKVVVLSVLLTVDFSSPLVKYFQKFIFYFFFLSKLSTIYIQIGL